MQRDLEILALCHMKSNYENFRNFGFASGFLGPRQSRSRANRQQEHRLQEWEKGVFRRYPGRYRGTGGCGDGGGGGGFIWISLD